MKRLFLFFSLIFPTFIFAQEPLKFSEIITVDSVSKSELFIRGREWFNDNFKSSKDVLQIQDKETGELSGKGFFKVQYTSNYLGKRNYDINVSFQVNLWVKEGKFKYEMINFQENEFIFGLITDSDETNKKYSGFSQKQLNYMYLSLKNNTIERAKIMIEDLKQKMSVKSKSTNW